MGEKHGQNTDLLHSPQRGGTSSAPFFLCGLERESDHESGPISTGSVHGYVVNRIPPQFCRTQVQDIFTQTFALIFLCIKVPLKQ